MRNKIKYFACICFVVFILTSGYKILFGSAPKDSSIYENLKVFSDVLSIVQESYVDEITAQKLVKGAIRGMIGTLDPHSQFMEKEEYRDLKIQTKGEFGGLGIVVSIEDNILTVISPIEDTPAFRAGILAGDKIIKIEEEYTQNMTLYEAINKMRGDPGTDVTISIFRDGYPDLIKFTLTRAKIPITSIKYSMLENKIGYIRLTEFKSKSGEELEKALEDLEKQGMQALILDLRHNPGGLLNVAVEVTNKFISRGRLIVYTKGRIEGQNMQFFADKEPTHPNFPLAVLVNMGSASASEIVSGAIQDWNRGIIIGTKTFGKASVQSIIPIDESSALRLTTAKYYTPSGKCIHGEGITPDIIVDMSPELLMKLYKQRIDEENLKVEEKQMEYLKDNIDSTKSKELINKVNQKKAKEKEKLVDTQIQTAIDLFNSQFLFTKSR
ncbi:MAG: S41 family peptidase [Candidatus Firestonebacteria bacterium]|nr:S41 family peptidase [Candidatus Firestonebacteria bacterium]